MIEWNLLQARKQIKLLDNIDSDSGKIKASILTIIIHSAIHTVMSLNISHANLQSYPPIQANTIYSLNNFCQYSKFSV